MFRSTIVALSVCGLSPAVPCYLVPLKSRGNPDVRNDLIERKIKGDIPVGLSFIAINSAKSLLVQ